MAYHWRPPALAFNGAVPMLGIDLIQYGGEHPLKTIEMYIQHILIPGCQVPMPFHGLWHLILTDKASVLDMVSLVSYTDTQGTFWHLWSMP